MSVSLDFMSEELFILIGILINEAMKETMSALNGLLSSFHLNATIFHRSLVCDPWSTDTSGSGLASFHLISSGKAFLFCDDYQAEPLTAGDLVIFPHDSPHIISHSPDKQTAITTDGFVAYPFSNNTPHSAGLMCGYFDFKEDSSHPVITQLPSCILIKSQQNQSVLASIIESLILEVTLGVQASDIILSRLSEVFFLSLLRQLSTEGNTQMGLFRALQDTKMAKVLQAINNNLAAPWDLNSLANVGGYSRASFINHFKNYLDTTPQEYLSQLRLSKAKKQLIRGDAVLKVALDVGYSNDVSFAKAFKRYFGYGPGVCRANSSSS
ncbi:AraC family transcriptional regulator [Shewanella woodyi]|uniref:AraC family transcriptional regulator n=1 Tax=Shewanella woodyi TaxID=60961 RepID=UPI003748114A